MSEEIVNDDVNAVSTESAPDARVYSSQEKRSVIESLLFASGEALGIELISQITRLEPEEVSSLIDELKMSYFERGGAIELVCVAEKFQLRTKVEYAPFIRELKNGGPKKLSSPALETLSIIAYRQPIVKSDVEKIRGVDATPTIKTLLDRDLIRIVGHQATVGQPALYGTTEQFLKLFSLSSLSELPTLRDMSELEREPGEEPSEPVAMEEEEVPEIELDMPIDQVAQPVE